MPAERRTRSRAASPALAVFSNARSPMCRRHRLCVCFIHFPYRLNAFPLELWENHPFCILHHVWSVLSRSLICIFFKLDSSTYIPSLSHFLMSKLFCSFSFPQPPGQLSSMDRVWFTCLAYSILRVYPFHLFPSFANFSLLFYFHGTFFFISLGHIYWV